MYYLDNEGDINYDLEGGISKDKENSNHKTEILRIRQELIDFDEREKFQEVFDDLMETLCLEAKDFSKELTLEYHIVVFNKELDTRFTILETKRVITKQKDEDYKSNSHGVVGKLYNKRSKSKFLMVQFGYENINPVVYINKSKKNIPVSIRVLHPDEYELFWSDGDKHKFCWDVTGNTIMQGESRKGKQQPSSVPIEEKIYAIATMLFYDENYGNEIPIGAISLDFVTRSENYPNFTFREKEVLKIYRILRNIKWIIELMLNYNTSNKLKQAINIAEGGEYEY